MAELQKTLELTVRLNTEHGEVSTVEVDVYEPESGDCKKLQFPYSPDEHPVLDEGLGNEIYSWIQVWADNVESGYSKKRRAVNIEWDTDGADVDLPTEVDIPDEVEDDEVEDWLSDKFGFCHLGFCLEQDEDEVHDETVCLSFKKLYAANGSMYLRLGGYIDASEDEDCECYNLMSDEDELLAEEGDKFIVVRESDTSVVLRGVERTVELLLTKEEYAMAVC